MGIDQSTASEYVIGGGGLISDDPPDFSTDEPKKILTNLSDQLRDIQKNSDSQNAQQILQDAIDNALLDLSIFTDRDREFPIDRVSGYKKASQLIFEKVKETMGDISGYNLCFEIHYGQKYWYDPEFQKIMDNMVFNFAFFKDIEDLTPDVLSDIVKNETLKDLKLYSENKWPDGEIDQEVFEHKKKFVLEYRLR